MHHQLTNKLPLIHLGYIMGLVLLFCNDWIWKYQFHNAFTGKLSDFVGLLIFPIFISFLFPRLAKHIVLIVGLGFIWWKTPLADGFIDGWNQILFFPISRVVDYSDYWALSMLPLSYALIRYQGRNAIIQPTKWTIPPSWRMVLGCCSILVFSSTSMRKANYPAGHILIDKGYEFSYDADTILKKLERMGLAVTRDSAYAGGAENFSSPYYQIALFIPAYPYDTDTLRDINFNLYESNPSESYLYLINTKIKDAWQLQDWNVLKRKTKYYKNLLENQLIEQLK